MNNKKDNALNLVFLAAGEALVSLLVIGAFLLGDLLFKSEFWSFSYRVVTGAALGSVVTVLNYIFLTITVDRAIKNFLDLRGNGEMSEEDAAAFAAKNSMGIQNAIKTSFLVRTASILITLVVAFILDWFSPVATVIPLLAYRPILTLTEAIKRRFCKSSSLSSAADTVVCNAHELGGIAKDITDNNNNNEEKESDV